MPRYVSDPHAEIIGQNVLGFVQNIQADEIHPYLEKYGLTEIDPNTWYPLNTWLAVLSDISEAPGASSNFVSVGLGISQTAVLPPGRENMTFEELISIYDVIYQMQHRNGDVGELVGEMVGPHHARVYVNTPFPIDMDYGVIYGFARRLLPPGTLFTVAYDETCEKTHEYGVIDITWD
jgi:hypothetical protein